MSKTKFICKNMKNILLVWIKNSRKLKFKKCLKTILGSFVSDKTLSVKTILKYHDLQIVKLSEKVLHNFSYFIKLCSNVVCAT